jgi:hypothetical protein
MAEINVTRTKVAQAAATKTSGGSFNRARVQFVDMAVAWSAAINDTAGTALVLPKGARLRGAVRLSTGAGNASATLSIGLRDASTKVAIDATALVNAASIATAQEQSLATGTKLTGGQFYVLPQDCEVYLTFGGAVPLANQLIRVELEFVAP